MKHLFLSLALTLVSATTVVEGGKFVDDLNREFNFKKGDRYATRAATGGLSLYHFGARDEISSVWGLWSVRGSDLDVSNPAAGSIYAEADPNVEEVEWLKTKNNLAPGCYTNPRGCFRWDNSSILEQYKNDIDYILYIDNGNDGNMRTVTNETGLPVVFIDTFYDYHPLCRNAEDYRTANRTKCFGRSMIDVAVRIEELAIAMEVDVDMDAMNAQKQASCDAAALFSSTMKTKQAQGLRFLTSINAIKKDDDGNDYFEFRTLDPIDLWVPRTLEELGMPLLHSDDGSLTLESVSTRVTTDEYFVDCPDGQAAASCNDNTLYPVDFWLFDSRSYLNLIGAGDGIFEAIFPDKAILAGQHWQYARNDGPLSFDAIARMLNEMTNRVKDAQRMHSATPCTNVDPKLEHTAQEGGGLDRNEYICYDEDLIQKRYLECPAVVEVEEDTKEDDPKDNEQLQQDTPGKDLSSSSKTTLGVSIALSGLLSMLL